MLKTCFVSLFALGGRGALTFWQGAPSFVEHATGEAQPNQPNTTSDKDATHTGRRFLKDVRLF